MRLLGHIRKGDSAGLQQNFRQFVLEGERKRKPRGASARGSSALGPSEAPPGATAGPEQRRSVGGRQ